MLNEIRLLLELEFGRKLSKKNLEEMADYLVRTLEISLREAHDLLRRLGYE